MNVLRIWQHPVKSCEGLEVNTAIVGKRGIAGDREWMIVNEHNVFVTQRLIPQMCLIRPSFRDGKLVLAAAGWGEIVVGYDDEESRCLAKVWAHAVSSAYVERDVDDWLTGFLGQFKVGRYRLVRIASDATRESKGGAGIAYVDRHPFTIVSWQSMNLLNMKATEAINTESFRPTLLVDTSEPHDEDCWRLLSIGEVRLEGIRPVERCPVIKMRQLSANHYLSDEPTRTLREYRQSSDGKIFFGSHFDHRSFGLISKGMAIRVYQRGAPPELQKT